MYKLSNAILTIKHAHAKQISANQLSYRGYQTMTITGNEVNMATL